MKQNPENPQNENVKVEQISSSDKKKNAPKRKNKVQPVYAVLTKARKQYAQQVDKKVGNKIKCIEANIAPHYADPLRFWLDFKTEAYVLLDSKRFCSDCDKKKANPEYVAEHLVFEGKKVVAKVLKEGVVNYGENIVKFNAPLFIDNENLYNQGVPEQPSSEPEIRTDSNKEE